MNSKPLSILCVVDRRDNSLARSLRSRGHTVLETYTGDQGVAVCVGNHFDAVVLDQDLFVETEGWSLAQSFKLVRPSLCILLVSGAKRFNHVKPKGVDEIVAAHDIPKIVSTLERLVVN